MTDKVSTQHLRKYIPFIDYVLKTDGNHEKFKQIKYWIENKICFKKESVDAMEQSIIIKYKALYLKKDLPLWVNKIFVNTQGEVASIDLCSDDDDNDDVEIISSGVINQEVISQTGNVVKAEYILSSDDDDIDVAKAAEDAVNIKEQFDTECKLFKRRSELKEEDSNDKIQIPNEKNNIPTVLKELTPSWFTKIHNINLSEPNEKTDPIPQIMSTVEDKSNLPVHNNNNNNYINFTSPDNSQFQNYMTPRIVPDYVRPQFPEFSNCALPAYPANYKPPNINDPRIRKRLQEADSALKLCGSFAIFQGVQLPTRNIASTQYPPVLQTTQSHEPRTYGEYRRRKELQERSQTVESLKTKSNEAQSINLKQNMVRDSLKTKSNEAQSINLKENMVGESLKTKSNEGQSINLEENMVKTSSNKNTNDHNLKLERELKRLELNGFMELRDYFTSNGKRISSIKARTAISNQLNQLQYLNKNEPSNNLIRKRRASISARTLISSQLNANSTQNKTSIGNDIDTSLHRISKRRKTVDGSYFQESVSNHEFKSLTNEKNQIPKAQNSSNLTLNKQPLVVLKRITEAEIQKYTQIKDINGLKKSNENHHKQTIKKSLIEPKPVSKKNKSQNELLVSNKSVSSSAASGFNEKKTTNQLNEPKPVSSKLSSVLSNLSQKDKSKNEVPASSKSLLSSVERCEKTTTKKLNEPKPATSKLSNVLVPIQKKDTSLPTQNSNEKTSKTTLKNTNIHMTYGGTKYCVLCKSKPNDLTNHYVQRHKTESYVSRLAKKQMEYLKENIPFATKLSSSKYEVECIFCGIIVRDSFLNFYNHFSIHTGEYAFGCLGCKLLRPFYCDIQSHKLHSKNCIRTGTKQFYTYPPNKMSITLYICKICNFAQLNMANVDKHLKEQHKKYQYDSSTIEQNIIAAIKSVENDSENQVQAEETPEEIENVGEMVTLRNAPFNKSSQNPIDNAGDIETLGTVPNNESSQEQIENAGDISTLGKVPIKESSQEQIENAGDINRIGNVSINENIEKIQIKNDVDQASVSNELSTYEISFEKPIQMDLDTQEFDEIKPDVGDWEIQPAHIAENTQQNFVEIKKEYRLIPETAAYFGLHKCMVFECFYSTNDYIEFLQHIHDHKTSSSPPEFNFTCAYCCTDFQTIKVLMQHIREKHEHDIYQCFYCCYRSCDARSVELHQTTSHPDTGKIIVKCAGTEYVRENMAASLQKEKCENVRKLSCLCCSFGCFAISTMIKHTKDIHGIHLSENDFEKYACIYCQSSAANLNRLENHVANEHPGKLLFVCERYLPDSAKDDVEALLLKDCGTCSTTEYIKDWQNISAGRMTHLASNDVKPNLDEIKLLEENIKAQLIKLTASTGLSPDSLYICPFSTCKGIFATYDIWFQHMRRRHCSLVAKCPHSEYCNESSQLDLEEFRQHFVEHMRHLYVCFHCGQTFQNELSIRKHFTENHNGLTDQPRIEPFRFNINYSYYVLISTKSEDRVTFLKSFNNVLIERLTQVIIELSEKYVSSWTVSPTERWLERYPSYFRPTNLRKKCFNKKCNFKSYNFDEVVDHCTASHQLKGLRLTFHCNRCKTAITLTDTCNDIKHHFKMHSSNLYICCSCSFIEFDPSSISNHCRRTHLKRDVPVLWLHRTESSTKFSISFIFPKSCKTFSTTRKCFCCDEFVSNPLFYAKHLKSVHDLKLQYTCEDCNVTFENLNTGKDHFEQAHPKDYKIRCEITTLNNVNLFVESVVPLKVRVEKNHKEILHIKKEKLCDSDCEILDEDDIEIAKLSGISNTEDVQATIKCISIDKLR